MSETNLVRSDGNLMMVAAQTDGKDERAYAVYRIMINGMPEELMIYLVRLFSRKTEGGVVLPGGKSANTGAQIKSEVYDKLLGAAMRGEEWLRSSENN